MGEQSLGHCWQLPSDSAETILYLSGFETGVKIHRFGLVDWAEEFSATRDGDLTFFCPYAFASMYRNTWRRLMTLYESS